MTCWLECDGRRFPLRDGVNIIGRSPHADVKLESPMVARGHARVEVKSDGMFLMDHHAINGTFIGEARLKAGERRRLADGDIVRVGDVELTFRAQEADS